MEELKLASVKFKSAGKVYYFSTNHHLEKGDFVVVETARGNFTRVKKYRRI